MDLVLSFFSGEGRLARLRVKRAALVVQPNFKARVNLISAGQSPENVWDPDLLNSADGPLRSIERYEVFQLKF